jgi:aminopeptidase N
MLYSSKLTRSTQLAVVVIAGHMGAVHAFTATHYELDLHPDLEAKVLHGRAHIKLKADTNASRSLELTSPTLEIFSAQLNGHEPAIQKTVTGWRVSLTEAESKAATLDLTVDYRAKASEGLVFGAKHVYTAFHTCQWMPCAGNDLTRASVAMNLELPQGYRSVASGVSEASPGKRTQRWSQMLPYPLYTFGFAAGLFTEVLATGTEPRLRYLGVNESEASLHAKFKESAQVLAFFEGKAGVPMPYSTYTQVLLPGSVAQEASSFSLIGKRMLDPILEDPQEDWVIAHEMAHVWWGNLITCATWGEFWLNEGITVFMTAAWKQHRWGDAAYQHEMGLARQRWQRAKDANFDKPLSWPGDYPSLGVRRAIQYNKGAVFMGVLREEMGDAAFWAGLRGYTVANAGRNVTSRDFQVAMQASTERNLQALFDAWVY